MGSREIWNKVTNTMSVVWEMEQISRNGNLEILQSKISNTARVVFPCYSKLRITIVANFCLCFHIRNLLLCTNYAIAPLHCDTNFRQQYCDFNFSRVPVD